MAGDPLPLVLVDGRNVQRSGWPNPGDGEFVAALDRWASGETLAGCEVRAVFDGFVEAPDPDRIELVEVPYADDELVDMALEAVAAGREVRVATSDRELKSRLQAAGADIAWGGGRLLRDLGFGRSEGRA